MRRRTEKPRRKNCRPRGSPRETGKTGGGNFLGVTQARLALPGVVAGGKNRRIGEWTPQESQIVPRGEFQETIERSGLKRSRSGRGEACWWSVEWWSSEGAENLKMARKRTGNTSERTSERCARCCKSIPPLPTFWVGFCYFYFYCFPPCDLLVVGLPVGGGWARGTFWST